MNVQPAIINIQNRSTTRTVQFGRKATQDEIRQWAEAHGQSPDKYTPSLCYIYQKGPGETIDRLRLMGSLFRRILAAPTKTEYFFIRSREEFERETAQKAAP